MRDNKKIKETRGEAGLRSEGFQVEEELEMEEKGFRR